MSVKQPFEKQHDDMNLVIFAYSEMGGCDIHRCWELVKR